MNPILAVLVCALAAHRVARGVAVDDITAPFRNWVGRRAWVIVAADPFPEGCRDVDDAILEGWRPPPEPMLRAGPIAWFYGLITCPHCVGFWISLGGYALWVNERGSHAWVAAVAVAGAQSIFAAKGMD